MKSVLVVDDDDVILSLVARAVAQLGLRVIRASSATEAMSILSSDRQVDLVVSDIQMPEMSGIELKRTMAQDLRWAAIPCILMTGGIIDELSPDEVVLRKPFSPIEIRCLVAAHIGAPCSEGQ